MARKSSRRSRRTEDPPDPFANYDENDPRDYAMGYETCSDGTQRYFSGHVDAPDYIRNPGRQQTYDEAGQMGYAHAAYENHMGGRAAG